MNFAYSKYSAYVSMQRLIQRIVFISSVDGQVIHLQVAEHQLLLNLKMKIGQMFGI